MLSFIDSVGAFIYINLAQVSWVKVEGPNIDGDSLFVFSFNNGEEVMTYPKKEDVERVKQFITNFSVK